jgi:hypothetical protein
VFGKDNAADVGGVQTFARYAFAPNELGYCGPRDFVELMRGDPGRLASRANEFDGAWTYLATIADAIGGRTPLDSDVVHAYWIGDDRLAQVDSRTLLRNLRQSFGVRAVGLLPAISEADRPPAHHNFHVLAVYPWSSLLSVDAGTPLSILQNCCIRPGRVELVADDFAEVTSRELMFDDLGLRFGPARTVRARWRLPGYEMVAEPAVGQHVTLHWDWICGGLEPAEVTELETITQHVLDIVNAHLGVDAG